MAGGLGTRLLPYTKTVPKGMLAIAGKPMLEHIITQAISDGFYKFIISICHLGNVIENYFGNGSKFGVEIEYIRETSPLGTAGALSLLSTRQKRPFVVSNCDVISSISYGRLLDFHLSHAASATMAVRTHEWENPFGVVNISGMEIIGIEEKPIARTNINAGVYVLDPGVIDLLEAGSYIDMPQLFNALRLASLKALAFPIHETWIDVGNEDQLVQANEQSRCKSERQN